MEIACLLLLLSLKIQQNENCRKRSFLSGNNGKGIAERACNGDAWNWKDFALSVGRGEFREVICPFLSFSFLIVGLNG